MAYSIISVENLVELKTRRGNSTNTTMATVLGLNYPTVEAFAVYVWDNLSTATPDDSQIVQPTVNGIPTGRWFKVDIGIDTALIIAALGYVPYDASNPLGFISSFIETDPIWTGVASNYRTKAQNDLLYEPIFSKNTAFNKNFGITAGTTTEGNDSRILNGQTAFGWGNHSGLYPLISGAYSDPIWIVNLAYSKLTGAPTIPTNNNQLVNGNGYITQSSTNTLTNKSGNISQWTNDSVYLTSVPAQSFSSLTGKPTTISGYGITDFNSLGDSRWSLLGHTHSFSSLTSKPTTLSGYAITDAYPLTGNPSSFLTGITSGQVTTALGYTPVPDNRTINGVTLTSNILLTKSDIGLGNIDNTSDLNKPISTTTQTALNAKQNTLVSGTNIKTVNGNTLLGSGDLTVGNTYTAGTGISIVSNVVTNTIPDQTVILTAGNRISITGTYPNFTIGYIEPNINIITSKTLNSNFTISSTKQAVVSYTLTVTVTNPLLAGSSTANVFLEYSTNGGTTWLLPSQNGNLSSVALAVAVAITSGQTSTVNGIIPANALVRLRTTTTGTASVTYVTGTEIY